MYKEITLKQYYLEILRKKSVLIIIALLIAALVFVYLYNDLKYQIDQQEYGAYGELYVLNSSALYDTRTAKESAVIKNISNIPEITNKNIYYMVSNDEMLKKYNLSPDEIKDAIYLNETYNNKVLKISAVSTNEEVATLVCNSFMSKALSIFIEKGYKAEIRADVEPMGTVHIETKEDSQDNGNILYMVNSINEKSLDIFSCLRLLGISSVIGLILSCMLICMRYTFSKKIYYYDQIRDEFKLLATAPIKNDLLNIYSLVMLSEYNSTEVSFISIKNTNELGEFIRCYVKEVEELGKDVLTYENLANSKSVDEINCFSDVKKKCDHYISVYNDISSSPLIKNEIEHRANTVFVMETGQLVLDDLKRINWLIDKLDLNVLGVVFLGKTK